LSPVSSDRLYQGLDDPDQHVKKNTLMVLTHLILNGMIKVKGQLGEMAKCIEDPDPRICDLARLFFKELSTKENALYNNLQDVISHLSVGDHAVDEETFEKTMRYIFTFIEKVRRPAHRGCFAAASEVLMLRTDRRRSTPQEKQAESIIEKLCQRFRLATDERQWRDIAFCLSLLPYKSERSMKKLIEGYVPNRRDSSAAIMRPAESSLPLAIADCPSTRTSSTRRRSSSALPRSFPRRAATSRPTSPTPSSMSLRRYGSCSHGVSTGAAAC
jgi:hypothetical protein